MKSTKFLGGILFSLLFILFSNTAISAQDNSKTSLDWNSVYRGVMPCADCAGVLTEIQLNKNGSCQINRRYLGNDNERDLKKGKFEWNDDGSSIRLILDGERSEFNQFQVAEGKLIKLDMHGKKINTLFPDYYELQDVKTSQGLLNTYWQLSKINNKGVDQFNFETTPFVVFFGNDRFYGNTGCNDFTGTYTYTKDGSVRANILAATLEACQDGDAESQYMHTFSFTENFTIDDGVMTFYQEGSKNTTEFIAQYFK